VSASPSPSRSIIAWRCFDRSNPDDWRKYAVLEKDTYTRNLVNAGNGKFNLMVVYWDKNNPRSPIHDHSGSHCFVKVLDGYMREVREGQYTSIWLSNNFFSQTRFFWPRDHQAEDGSLIVEKQTDFVRNEVSYMCDKLGLHRMENASMTQQMATLHLYSPPFGECQARDAWEG